MTKTTFLGYVPSLKSKHEATIVNGRAMKSKGGSIRYLLEGEYDGRKTLPKTVSKEDFVKVYGFDAKEAESVLVVGEVDGDFGKQEVVAGYVKGVTDKKGFTPINIQSYDHQILDGSVMDEGLKSNLVNHADTVGNPSPADVEPPAPSEKPFPQEPSNENFSADGASLQTYFIEQEITWKTPEDIRQTIVDLGLEGNVEADLILNDDKALNEFADALMKAGRTETTKAVPIMWEDYYGDDDGDNNGKIYGISYTDGYEVLDMEWFTTAKERDASIKEYNETEVKEAFGLFGKKDEKEEEKEEPKTQEFTVVLQEGDKLELTDIEEEQEAPDDENKEKEAETLEITDIDWETDDEDVDLPASVLVPSSVVEDEIADYLSDEYGFLVRGYVLNAETYEAVQAKVTRPVKEEEESDEGLSTGAKVALGVGALAAGVALFGAEEDDYDPYESETDYSRIYEASVNVGEKRIMSRKDYDIDNELSGFSNMDYTLDLDEHEDEIAESVESELIDAIRESVDENLPISDGDSGSGSVNVDTEIEISVPISGDIDYEWDATINHEDDEHDEDWNAEHESETDGYTYAYTKGHKDGMDNEVIYRPSIETDREKTIFKKILKQKAEGVYISGIKDDKTESRVHIVGDKDADGFTPKEIEGFDTNNLTPVETKITKSYGKNHGSETVGSPSPSGPSSTPEPAEATGSEPSNENMEAEGSNMKMAMGVLALGVGAVALLGGDRIKKIFDRFNL